MDGIELALRFSYIVNAEPLRYCGPPQAEPEFQRYLAHHDNPQQVREALTKFEALYPYLTTIAQKHHLDPFDYKVVEAYWLGNQLLDAFTTRDMQEIITKLMQRGLLPSLGRKLIHELPEGFFPHHNFNVFYVGVGKTSGKVETTLRNMDNCRPSWGEVAEVLENALIVQTPALKQEHGKYYLHEEPKTVVYQKTMLPTVSIGDIVALHWGFAPLILTPEQHKNIQHYTEKTLVIMNRIQPSDT
jgi:hypothetical protein